MHYHKVNTHVITTRVIKEYYQHTKASLMSPPKQYILEGYFTEYIFLFGSYFHLHTRDIIPSSLDFIFPLEKAIVILLIL